MSEAIRQHTCQPYFETLLKGKPLVTQPRFYKTNKLECKIRRTVQGTENYCPTSDRLLANDRLNTELVYYLGYLKELIASLSLYSDRQKVGPWIERLLAPEFHVIPLRTKRNKYMLHLVLMLTTDSVFGTFQTLPNISELDEPEDLRSSGVLERARWEKDNYWKELLRGLMSEESEMKCSYHNYCGENEENGSSHPIVGALLDQEFKFFLYLARPMIPLIPNLIQRAHTAYWIFTLAKVTNCACLTMKAVRNDYMTALLGYLQDLRLAGLFCRLPPQGGTTLRPLEEVSKHHSKICPGECMTNPQSQQAEDFMMNQPVPTSGAFCYIAVTGDVQTAERANTAPLSTTKYDQYFGF